MPSKTAELRSPLAWLRVVLWFASVVPALLFAAVGWELYLREAAEAETRVDGVVRIGEEHALKVLETNLALLQRVLDLTGDDSDEVLLARGPSLHQRIKRMTVDLPQLQGIFVIDSKGRMVATDRMPAAPRSIDFSDREFFRHHRSGGSQPYVSSVLTSRSTGELFFDVSLRRSRADGSFGGTLSASLRPQYFENFYRDLTGQVEGLHIALLRADGAVLARWPPASAASDAAPRADAGSDATIRPLQKYPVLVSAGMPRSAVLARWSRQVLLLAALAIPTGAALVYVAWVALHRTRRSIQVAEALQEETSTRRRVEESLRQAQKLEALGRLTGGVAHDFNNLLMIVSSNLYLHKRRQPSLSDSAQLSAIERAVAAGSSLTRQLLSFSRREASPPETIRLQDRLPGMLNLVRPALGAAVQVDVDIDPAAASIEVDAAELELALLNLAINAKDAMVTGGRLQVHVANAAPGEPPGFDGRFVSVSVRDSGPGIAAHDLQRVFEPFFTTKPVGQGTGLGLSQVYGFCKRAGGTASVESLANEGATVRMYFPAADPLRQAQDEPRARPRDDQALAYRVLLVEDNDEVALATQSVLQSMGCTVHRVGDAGAAIQHLAAHAAEFDVMVSDIVMPGPIDGIKLAADTQATHPGLAVLLLSGFSESMDAATHLSLGILLKPCEPAALAEGLRSAVLRTRSVAGGFAVAASQAA